MVALIFFAFGKALEMAFRESMADMPNVLGKYLVSFEQASAVQESSHSACDDNKDSVIPENHDESNDGDDG